MLREYFPNGLQGRSQQTFLYMKTRFNLALLMVLLLQTSYGQTEGTYLPASECSNFNAFLTGSTFDSLKYFTDTIYPSGIMRFDLSKLQEYGGVEDLHPLLGVDQGSTFELVNMVNSRFNSDRKYLRYQQYFDGVKVEGGGYTVTAFYIPDEPPGDPCAVAYMLSPHIVSGINLSVQPRIASTSLDSILNSSVIQSGNQLSDEDVEAELIITHNLLNNCEYYLAWKTMYPHQGTKISWVDAQTGNVLKTVDGQINLTAPTEIYGNQNLNDNTVGNTTFLATPDNRVVAFDFNVFPDCRNRTIADFAGAATPSTTAATWTTAVAPASMYQSFFVASSLVPVFDGVGINFGTINVGIDCPEQNAFSLGGSTLANAFIVIGGNATNSFGVFDAIGHELGHTFLNDFLNSNNAGNGSLHEGIADMIGTYAESVIQGTPDWVIGDDLPALATAVDRNLESPEWDCFTDVSGFTEIHDRSEPLGHWFFIISQGKGNIIGLGINKAINIVLESLNLMGVNDDYGDMRAATLAFVDDEFGPCSLEGYTVRRAWNEICVGPSDYTDCFHIAGNPWVCEEDDGLHLWIENPAQGAVYWWTFPIEWTVQGSPGNPSGNLYVGNHFVVTDFPKYNWYPKYFNIKVYSPTLGSQFNQFRIVKLIDCNGDDPTCEEYYSLQGGGENEDRSSTGGDGQASERHSKGIALLKVHDIVGRLLYSGIPEGFDRNSVSRSGMVILTYFDDSGEFVKSEKILLLKY